MVYIHKKYSQKLKEGNRLLILMLLQNGPKRFRDLQKETDLSAMGLANILKDLASKSKSTEAKITKKQIGKWPVYEITESGISLIRNTMTLGIIADEIVKDDGQYFHNYSKIYSSIEKSGPWGIQDDIIINKDLEKEIPVFLHKIIKDTHVNIYKKFQDIMYTDTDPMKVIEKRIVIGFVIDTTGLLQSIKENSIEILKEMDKPAKTKPKKEKSRSKK